MRDLVTSSATPGCLSIRWRCRTIRYQSAINIKRNKKHYLPFTLTHLAHFITVARLLRLQRALTHLHSRAWAHSPVGIQLLRFPFSSGRSSKRRKRWQIWALSISSLRTEMEIRKLWNFSYSLEMWRMWNHKSLNLLSIYPIPYKHA